MVVPWLSYNMIVCVPNFYTIHGSLNVPIEHHPTIRYMVYNGYYKVMSNSPKMGHLPIPAWLYPNPNFHIPSPSRRPGLRWAQRCQKLKERRCERAICMCSSWTLEEFTNNDSMKMRNYMGYPQFMIIYIYIIIINNNNNNRTWISGIMESYCMGLSGK